MGNDPAIRDWYRRLMQPVMPLSSCCGEADAYWADSYQADGDRYVAIITDPRPDGPLHRRHIDIGITFVVPNHKLKYDASNSTGHGIIFLNPYDFVLCYVPPGGVQFGWLRNSHRSIECSGAMSEFGTFETCRDF
jgi:hypothetical protein